MTTEQTQETPKCGLDDSVKQIVDLPYMEKTSRGYEVCGPDSDGDVEIDIDGELNGFIWLTEADVRMLLRRIQHQKANNSAIDGNSQPIARTEEGGAE